MDIDRLRKENEAKAEEEKERGPVGSGPASAPVGEAIEDFHSRGALPFGIPAHRAGTGSSATTPSAGPAPVPSPPTSG
jgi:hypothetical protein